jgi:hypothetical protein
VYELHWRSRLHARSLAAESELTGEGRVLSLRKKHPSNLLERGWTARALYTPPGFYDGPNLPQALRPLIEDWLVRETMAFLKAESESPSLPHPIKITIHAPANLGRVAAKEAAVRVSLRSPTPLERIRIELDGERLAESRTVGIPSGLCFPSGFGMYRRRTGCGRYLPALRQSRSSVRNPTTPRCSIVFRVSPSTPAAPPLALTRLHASHRTSPLWIRSNSAWNRRFEFRLADTKRLR